MTRSFCVGIFDNQRGGTVIGASLMREREVVFDLARSAISFVESNCATISPATSALEGGYAFDSCPASHNQTAAGAPARKP